MKARNAFLVEEYITGQEYSCDFFIEGDTVRIIRIARKWLKPDQAPGIAMAYQVPGKLPLGIDPEMFRETLRRAAQALGMERALCMLDFLVSSQRLVLLELAPRPGGDCLPPLIRASCGLDIIGLELDVAECRPWRVPTPHEWQPLVGLRLFAPRAGTIAALDAGPLANDPRVRQVFLTRGPGDRVIHPPEDYQSRILGWAIFRPFNEATIEQECHDLHNKLVIRYLEKERT
ncbi:MAG: ATP-grasp domain-containing protein [Deltaproteobacteria bacterium]|nr:ATP-grasp domain-containing protein [Deltaproteobacteria bacterium]